MPQVGAEPSAVDRFAATLPHRVRATTILEFGLDWLPRAVALLEDEIAPDPPGWRTSLRFDVDCPCDGAPHGKRGYCETAATVWRDAGLPEPSFVVVNPGNGHAHVVYLLAAWVRVGSEAASDFPAVRYLAAIERAYSEALRADRGYSGVAHHNPLSSSYKTTPGRVQPYSLSELAGYVTLAPRPRRKREIRNLGRNVETFDSLRFWAYEAIADWRCGSYADWLESVEQRAREIAVSVRDAHPNPTHPYPDREVGQTAKSVALWVWKRYDSAAPALAATRTAVRREADRKRDLTKRRLAGAVPRDEYLEAAEDRRRAAARLSDMGVTVTEIARRLSAGVRSVYRWLSELRQLPTPSAPSDFTRGKPVRKQGVGETEQAEERSYSPLRLASRALRVARSVGPQTDTSTTPRRRSAESPKRPRIDLMAYARAKLWGSSPSIATSDLQSSESRSLTFPLKL